MSCKRKYIDKKCEDTCEYNEWGFKYVGALLEMCPMYIDCFIDANSTTVSEDNLVFANVLNKVTNGSEIENAFEVMKEFGTLPKYDESRCWIKDLARQKFIDRIRKGRRESLMQEAFENIYKVDLKKLNVKWPFGSIPEASIDTKPLEDEIVDVLNEEVCSYLYAIAEGCAATSVIDEGNGTTTYNITEMNAKEIDCAYIQEDGKCIKGIGQTSCIVLYGYTIADCVGYKSRSTTQSKVDKIKKLLRGN